MVDERKGWFYRGKPLKEFNFNLDKYWGFTYLITHVETAKKYIGKKGLWKTTVSGSGERGVCPSNWKNYWGSCQSLKKQIKAEGLHKFKREILRFYTSEEGLKKAEIKLLNKIRDYSSYFNRL